MLFGEKSVRKSQSSSGLKATDPLITLSAIDRGFFAPSISEDTGSENYPSTPPAQLLSPQPRTPRPTKFLSPPRTPLSKLFTNFPTSVGTYQEANPSAEGSESIARPGSACSSYSSSSDSSFDSLTTFTTTGGSCTSPETESSFFPDGPVAEEGGDPTTKANRSSSAKERDRTDRGGKGGVQSRIRTVQWTEDMDGHLWRTYMLCQQDPKTTPFFVLPGQVPPLGVCHRVAREAKRSWKEAKMGDGWRSPLNTSRSRQRRFITPAREAGAGNRGDVLRKASLYSWPASEASTRKRLRELCRRSYGPSRNPHHGYHQRRPASTAGTMPSRSSTISPSPYQSAASGRLDSRDSFLFSTRGIALSLTTSTASTMNPGGVLAAIAAGYDVHAETAVGSRCSGVNICVPGRISGENSNDHDVLGIGGFVNVGPRLGSGDVGSNVTQDSTSMVGISGFSDIGSPAPTRNGSGQTTPALLPPLELHSSSSAYGTWPRRLKRQEELESGDESITLPPPRRARRGTIGDLFGEPVPVSTTMRTRTRGYTIGSSAGNSISRRRYRPLAPLLTVTGPVSYDSPNDGESLSPLASRESMIDPFRDSSETPGRLGSPFMERKDWKGQQFEGPDELLSEVGDEEFLEPRYGDGVTSIRPMKRARE